MDATDFLKAKNNHLKKGCAMFICILPDATTEYAAYLTTQVVVISPQYVWIREKP